MIRCLAWSSLANFGSGQLLQKGLGGKAKAEGSTEVREEVDRKPSTREGLGCLSLSQDHGKDLGKKAWSGVFRRKAAGSGPSRSTKNGGNLMSIELG